MRPSVYTELPPPDRLRNEVVCLWHETIVDASDGALKVLPDGVVDIVWVDDALPFVAGPMTHPSAPAFRTGTELVGVRLRPGVAHRILGVDMHELVDRSIDVCEILPVAKRAAWEIPPAPATPRGLDIDLGTSGRLRGIADLMEERLASTSTGDGIVEAAAAWLARHPVAPISELSAIYGLSQRQVQRRFVEGVGYGPKLLQRILRLQLWLWLANQPRADLTLAGLALAAGYADQSHMTRETNDLTGVAPSVLLANDTASSTVSDLFNTPSS